MCKNSICRVYNIESYCSRFAGLHDALEPFVSKPNQTSNLLSNMPKTVDVLQSLQKSLDKPEVKKLLGE